ncbi:MAG: hypothetical protein GHCLOJNM_03341 [bacterium]|nr:hypothetical protein [bacterium]
MYLLYLDESGNENDPKDRCFVLGGIALFERQTYFLTREIEELHKRHFPGRQPVHFHASEIRSGRDFWRKVQPETRERVLADLCTLVERSPSKGRALFAAVVEKSDVLYGEDAVEKATEEICRRFDIFLQRHYHHRNEAQRGLIIFSEGRFDARAKIWVRGFHQRGTRWGAINNLADIPYFAPMRESRLLQVADLVAHSIWLLYERRDPSLAKRLMKSFDSTDGILHGLVHVRSDPESVCECPACHSRKFPNSHGPWLSRHPGEDA